MTVSMYGYTLLTQKRKKVVLFFLIVTLHTDAECASPNICVGLYAAFLADLATWSFDKLMQTEENIWLIVVLRFFQPTYLISTVKHRMNLGVMMALRCSRNSASRCTVA